MIRSKLLSGSLASVSRASPMTASSLGWQLARKVKWFDFAAMSTTIGSISKKRHASACANSS